MSSMKDRVKKLHPPTFKDKLKDVWDDIDLWFWRHFVNPISTRKDRLVYAWERATKGFDRRISWSDKAMADFYVNLLTDLIDNSDARPMGIHDVVPEDFSKLASKWNAILGTKYTTDYEFAMSKEMSDSQHSEYSSDCFELWKNYLKRVRRYFLESQVETCSQKNEYYDDFVFNPIWVEQEDGTYLMETDTTPEQEEKNKLFSDRERVLEKYREDCLKKGLSEIAKNPYAFSW